MIINSGLSTELIVGVLGGVAAIIAASKWIADAFREWRLGRELKFKDIMAELELEKQKTTNAQKEITKMRLELSMQKAQLDKMKMRLDAIIPLLRHLNAEDKQTQSLLDLIQDDDNITPARS